MLKFCGIDHSQFGEKPSNPPKRSKLDASSISSYSSHYFQTVFITKNGVAMAAGDNQKALISESLPRQVIADFTKFDIKDKEGHIYQPVSAYCGEHFTLYLVLDPNDDKKNILAYKNDKVDCEFTVFLKGDNLNPIALFGGLHNAAAIDDKGAVIFLFELSRNLYTEIIASHLLNGEKAVSVACLVDEVFVLSSSGKLFVSRNLGGKELTFSQVGSLNGIKIIGVSGIYQHCLALSEDGKVFGYGKNDSGELGIGEEIKKLDKFKEIESLRKYKIKAVYAGNNFSLFQTDKGELLACGENKYGALLGKDSERKKYYLPIETEIKEGATFCVASECSSSVFIGTDPIMSPNRRIGIEKVPSRPKAAKDEISSLKAEISRLKEKIKALESQQPPKPPQTGIKFELFDQKTVNEMNIIERLGRGAQSEVYKVSRPHYYVLKVLFVTDGKKKSKSDDSFKQLKRFIQEYDILRTLNHQNIICTYGFCYGDDTHPPSILLQFCPHNLSDHIEELNVIQKVCAIFEICLGMEAVHAANLIHRDLKPENILIDEDGHIRISDFGVSCLVDLESQTQSKTTGVGTLKFMAPELLNENEHYDNKVDVYSFGVVAFFILTGGKMPKISFAEQVTGKKAQIPKEVNEFAKKLINSCWSALPEERPSFTQIIEMIKSNNFKLIDGVEKNVKQIKQFLSI